MDVSHQIIEQARRQQLHAGLQILPMHALDWGW